ncbi:tol-pal system protein YbgF [Ollibium composti]|uniref:Cell division coordinator CpoB n=1 Tax=Ollibium composti TaxID=2675109 RepID=A0ABY2Q402_9HYPH|nr:tol-pal system protein YbgF [Mesorhizobium composti]THF54646.1 tol-pal system protein YbgF [Mesorhizobium composti]
MHFRSILSGTLAVLLASAVAAPASGVSGAERTDSGFSFHMPSFGLPGVFGSGGQDKVQMAQSNAAGVTGLEDQIRQLNGKVEELNFQILQMQEQIRKQQEDNEFRFQQLEGGGGQAPQKKSDASGGGNTAVAAAPATQPGADTSASGDGPSDPVGDIIVDSGNGEPGKLITGAPAKTFGTITVDKDGNVVDAGGTQSTAAGASPPAGGDAGSGSGTQVASLPATDNPDELYRNSYQFILSGDYKTAEQGFRDYVSRFPKDSKASDAHYWLGEALLGQQKYRDAAETFLAASKAYPKAKKAPDMLLKLGVSLVGLNQRDVACATFNEVGKRYPNISAAMKERVKQERTHAAC